MFHARLRKRMTIYDDTKALDCGNCSNEGVNSLNLTIVKSHKRLHHERFVVINNIYLLYALFKIYTFSDRCIFLEVRRNKLNCWTFCTKCLHESFP